MGQPQTDIVPRKKAHRALRGIVWAGRIVGWVLVGLAIFNFLPAGTFGPFYGSLKVLASIALGLLGVCWIIGLELFLRFFDRYLSHN